MTEQQRKRARYHILQGLHVVHPNELTADNIQHGLVLDGFKVSPDEVHSELDALGEAGLVTQKPHPIDAAIIRWKRTEAGRVALVEAGLI